MVPVNHLSYRPEIQPRVLWISLQLVERRSIRHAPSHPAPYSGGLAWLPHVALASSAMVPESSQRLWQPRRAKCLSALCQNKYAPLPSRHAYLLHRVVPGKSHCNRVRRCPVLKAASRGQRPTLLPHTCAERFVPEKDKC